MDGPPAPARRIFVLGRRCRMDVEAAAHAAAREGAELVLLSLGYPVTGEQRAIVDTAVRLAVDLRVKLDAILVLSPTEMTDLVRAGEDVTILASGRQLRRLRTALGPLLRIA